MLYFRMTLPTDYQQSPIIFGMLPNRLYMTIIQILGIVLLIYNVLGIIVFMILHMHIIQENSKWLIYDYISMILMISKTILEEKYLHILLIQSS